MAVRTCVSVWFLFHFIQELSSSQFRVNLNSPKVPKSKVLLLLLERVLSRTSPLLRGDVREAREDLERGLQDVERHNCFGGVSSVTS